MHLPRLLASAFALALLSPGTTVAAESTNPDDASIRRHRMGRLVIETTPGATVEVRQTRHEFWFGAAIASSAFNGQLSRTDTERYKQVFLENFNCGVPENAFKWLDMERRRGEVHYATVDAMLAWADHHQIPLRGHNVYWGIEHWVMPWQKTLDDATLHQVLEQRGRDVGRRYKGRFAEYDLNNEMIHGNYYAERFGPTITREMAGWIKAEDPAAVLYVNDYDILTGERLDQYVAHIRELQAMGVPLGGIGVQGHLHGDSFDPAALRHALDVLAEFHLPIRVTEFNFPGQRSKFYEHRDLPISPAEEEAKARALTEYYRICFAHPAVDGILMWGFWEGANWIPQSSLFKRDWSPTPAANAYRQLVFGDWWTHWTGKADASGHCEVPAFYGTYQITAVDKVVNATLKKSAGEVVVRIAQP
jgi:GH35 family endo-1,4-beta-xylanase